MSEYIDKERLLRVLDKNFCSIGGAEVLKQIIEAQPPADVRSVVRGEWIYDPNGMDFNLGAWICSKCSCRNSNLPLNKNMNPLIFLGSSFCPNCGADMRGEKE